jgi:hypothetical protein
MSALDTIAGVGAGCYLLAVAVNGNSKALIETAKRDKGFIKWAIAVAILLYAMRYKQMAEPVAMIIATAFLGLFLKNGTKIAEQANSFWRTLDSN